MPIGHVAEAGRGPELPLDSNLYKLKGCEIMIAIATRLSGVTDDLSRAARQAYTARGGLGRPITAKDLPEDVVARAVTEVASAAPQAARRSLLKTISSASRRTRYALAAGGTVTLATLLDATDGEFFNLLTQLTPDAMLQFGNDVAQAENGASVAEVAAQVGDAMYVGSMMARNFDEDKDLQPVSKAQGSINLGFGELQKLQAYTDSYERVYDALGSFEIIEAIIWLGNDTSPEDRVALYDNMRHKRGL